MLVTCLGVASLSATGCGAQVAVNGGKKKETKINLGQLALACLMENDVRGHMARNIRDKSGQPLLSWRVAILPYLEEQSLYSQFKLDEPWDSPHNRPLLQKMPRIFRAPRYQNPADKLTVTHYRGFGGDGGVLGSSEPVTMQQISNFNTVSRTVLLVEAPEPCPGPSPMTWSTT
jgi:hypothetical protein